MIPAIPTLAVSPPVVVRCWNTMPFAGVIVSEACIESAVSAWRIMMPPLAHPSVFCRLVIFAVICWSPDSRLYMN